MVPRRILVFLVFALPVLVVAFAVLMGGFSLAAATGDSMAAMALRWVAMGCLMLLVADFVLLVGVLGINALASPDDENGFDEE